MKNITACACLAGALALPGLVQAHPVTLTAQLKNYAGNGAYLAVYVTDAAGKCPVLFDHKRDSTATLPNTGSTI